MRYLLALMLVWPGLAQERELGDAKERAIGQSLAREIQRQTTTIHSPPIQAYVERLVAKLDPGGTFTVDLVRNTETAANPTHEPVAIPGGALFVSAGLIEASSEEAELVGMLAHAMAHVRARHGIRQATRGQIANLSTIPLIFMGSQAGGMVPLGFIEIQRGFESQADQMAVETLVKVGYDPFSLAGYIRRMQPELSEDRQRFSPLPARAERVAAIEAEARRLSRR